MDQYGPVYEFAGERLLYSKIRPYLNKLTVVDLRGYCSSDMYPLEPDVSRVPITYLATYMLSDTFNESIRGYYERYQRGARDELRVGVGAAFGDPGDFAAVLAGLAKLRNRLAFNSFRNSRIGHVPVAVS